MFTHPVLFLNKSSLSKLSLICNFFQTSLGHKGAGSVALGCWESRWHFSSGPQLTNGSIWILQILAWEAERVEGRSPGLGVKIPECWSHSLPAHGRVTVSLGLSSSRFQLTSELPLRSAVFSFNKCITWFLAEE